MCHWCNNQCQIIVAIVVNCTFKWTSTLQPIDINAYVVAHRCMQINCMQFKHLNLVDPASSHMLVSKIKPCMCVYMLLHCDTADRSLNQLLVMLCNANTWTIIVILELIHAWRPDEDDGSYLSAEHNPLNTLGYIEHRWWTDRAVFSRCIINVLDLSAFDCNIFDYNCNDGWRRIRVRSWRGSIRNCYHI